VYVDEAQRLRSFPAPESENTGSDFDQVVFKKKTFANIIEEIYESKMARSIKINGFIDDVKGMIGNATEAAILIPSLTSCLEVDVKNDELLVKAATLIQRAIARERSVGAPDEMGGVMFNDQEIKELEEIRNKFLEEKAPKQIKEVIETISIELSEIESEMKKPIEIEGTTFDDDVFEELRKELEGEDN
jgi:hypothetical protein